MKHAMKVVSPSFYKAQYAGVVRSVHADVVAGNIRPLFQAALLVGVVGYTMEYVTIGRWHVIDKQAAVAKALKDVHH